MEGIDWTVVRLPRGTLVKLKDLAHKQLSDYVHGRREMPAGGKPTLPALWAVIEELIKFKQDHTARSRKASRRRKEPSKPPVDQTATPTVPSDS